MNGRYKHKRRDGWRSFFGGTTSLYYRGGYIAAMVNTERCEGMPPQPWQMRICQDPDGSLRSGLRDDALWQRCASTTRGGAKREALCALSGGTPPAAKPTREAWETRDWREMMTRHARTSLRVVARSGRCDPRVRAIYKRMLRLQLHPERFAKWLETDGTRGLKPVARWGAKNAYRCRSVRDVPDLIRALAVTPSSSK